MFYWDLMPDFIDLFFFILKHCKKFEGVKLFQFIILIQFFNFITFLQYHSYFPRNYAIYSNNTIAF